MRNLMACALVTVISACGVDLPPISAFKGPDGTVVASDGGMADAGRMDAGEAPVDAGMAPDAAMQADAGCPAPLNECLDGTCQAMCPEVDAGQPMDAGMTPDAGTACEYPPGPGGICPGGSLPFHQDGLIYCVQPCTISCSSAGLVCIGGGCFPTDGVFIYCPVS